MFSINLDYCNFRYDVSENSHKSAYLLLESIAGDYPVVWLNEMICQNRRCGTHFGNDFIYRDGGHLSYEGSSALGRHANFYGLITSRSEEHTSELQSIMRSSYAVFCLKKKTVS